MARLYLRKTLTGSFIAADEPSAELAKKFAAGGIFRADIRKPRSLAHHRLCMALLSLTWENLPEQYEGRWHSFDDFRYGVAVEAGHCVELVTPSGEVFKRARSISFDELDEAEFSAVMPRLMSVCCGLLRVSAPELEAELSRYAGERYGSIAA